MASGPLKGTIHEGLLTSLLRDLYRERRTGSLVFRRGEERRSFRVQQGQVVNADSSVRDDRMGEILVREGQLSAADLKRAVGFMLRDKKRLGLVLEDLGMRYLPPSAAEDLLEVFVRRYERGAIVVTSNRPLEDWGVDSHDL